MTPPTPLQAAREALAECIDEFASIDEGKTVSKRALTVLALIDDELAKGGDANANAHGANDDVGGEQPQPSDNTRAGVTTGPSDQPSIMAQACYGEPDYPGPSAQAMSEIDTARERANLRHPISGEQACKYLDEIDRLHVELATARAEALASINPPPNKINLESPR